MKQICFLTSRLSVFEKTVSNRKAVVLDVAVSLPTQVKTKLNMETRKETIKGGGIKREKEVKCQKDRSRSVTVGLETDTDSATEKDTCELNKEFFDIQ